MGESTERERRLHTSLAAAQACAEYASERAEHWRMEAGRAASLAASIRTLLAERAPAGRAGRVESAETLTEAFRAAGVPLMSDRDRDPLDHSGCAVLARRCAEPGCPIFTS